MPVRVVEEPEVVDVDQRHADLGLVAPRRLDLLREQRHHRPVVQHAGQRIAARRVEQLAVLTGEARLRRSEDEEQHRRQQNARHHRHQHDVALRGFQPGHERPGVAPDSHHGEGRAVTADDGQILLHHAVRVRKAAGGLGRGPRLEENRGRARFQRGRHPARNAGSRPDEVAVIADEHAAIHVTDLEPRDRVVAIGEDTEQSGQLDRAVIADAVRIEVALAQIAVDEVLDQRGIAVHDAHDGRGAEVLGSHGDEGAGGHAEKRKGDAEDEGEQHRSTGVLAWAPSEQHGGTVGARGPGGR